MNEELNDLKVSKELLEKLSEHGTVKIFKSGEIILNENSFIRSIPIVIKGAMKVLRTEEDGREILLYYIREGESCIMSILGGMHREMSKVKAQVETESEILFLPVDKIYWLFKDSPQWIDYVFKLYHKRFEELLDVINAIAFKKVDERLLELLNKKKKLTNSNIILITHEQLANELGTARVVISRLLKQLEDQNILQLGRNKIILM